MRDDAAGAFFWVANWVFVFRDTDYFTQGDPPSPLQHTWSLAVEEQYYVLWPLVLLAVAVALALLTRHRDTKPKLRTVRMVVVGVAVAGAAASAVASCLMVSGTSPASLNRVYFGTDTRVQALLVGAAAAALLVRDWPALARYGAQIRSRWGRVVAQILPVIGLAMLGVVAHFATGSAPEFRRGLLIVVAVAAVFIVAPVALEQRGLVARVLAFPPLVWLGVISYGVYLWHWPIFLALNGGAHRPDGDVAVRDPGGGDGDLIGDVVVAHRAADQALAARARSAAAPRRSDTGDGGRRDDARRAGRHQAG